MRNLEGGFVGLLGLSCVGLWISLGGRKRERERERADGHEKAQEDTTYIESMTGAERSKTFLGKPGGKKGPLEGEE